MKSNCRRILLQVSHNINLSAVGMLQSKYPLRPFSLCRTSCSTRRPGPPLRCSPHSRTQCATECDIPVTREKK